MENEQRNYLSKIDPRNLKVTLKIILLVITLVSLVMLVFFSFGLKTLRTSLMKASAGQVTELCYMKGQEVESALKYTGDKLLNLASSEELRMATDQLTRAFIKLNAEMYSVPGFESMSQVKEQIRLYYEQTIVPKSPLSGKKVLKYIPQNEKTLLGQFIYLCKNPKSFEEKAALVSIAEDYTSYGFAHKTHHNYFLHLRELLKACDIYLVDPRTGYVVYSLGKNLDFGTNLYDGELKDSKLSVAFRKGLAADRTEVSFVDFSNYPGAADKPVSFFSVPVYSYNQLISVLIVSYAPNLFDDVLTTIDMAAGSGSLEYTVIGRDLLLRNNPKKFLLDRDNYLQKLMRKTAKKDIDRVINYRETGNMALLAGYPAEYSEILLSEGNVLLTDYCNTKVIAYTKKIQLPGSEFYLQAKINQAEVLHPFITRLRLFLLIAMVLLFLIFLVSYYFGKSLTRRIESLHDAMILLHNGEKAKELEKGSDDEVGNVVDTFNKLRKRINNAEEFALEMSEGNYNYKFDIISERDSLGKSLNVLKEKLIQSRDEHEERAREDEIRNWINIGVAKFNDLLRQNNTDINLLSYSIIENLTAYVGANIGGIFLVEGDKEKHIELAASYAYDRRKFIQKRMEVNEGLLGACYLEKKPIYLTKIPEEYIEISSGLGHKEPACLYIVPLKVDEEVLGMIEIGSVEEFKKHHLEFIDQVSGSIAATFVSVRLNMKTVTLLEESNRKAEEITQAEEEMRQNLEEMQATQEELARLRQEDEKHRKEMQLIIDNTRLMLRNLIDIIPGGYVLKDQAGVIHLANAEGADFYGLAVDRVLGKTEYELLGAKISEAEHKTDLETIEKGELEFVGEYDIKGKKKTYRIVKKPFNIREIGQMGILTMRFPVKE